MSHLDVLSDDELEVLAADALAELQARAAKKNRHNVVFTQTRDTLVCLENGAPADRAGWFYLPFLSGLSRAFQPKKLNGRQVYEECFPENTILEVKSRKDGAVLNRVKTGGARSGKQEGKDGFFMAGEFTGLGKLGGVLCL